MRIKFTATSTMKSYHDIPSYEDGDIREVPDHQGKYLCETFPLNFSIVKGMAQPEVVKVQPEPDRPKNKGRR